MISVPYTNHATTKYKMLWMPTNVLLNLIHPILTSSNVWNCFANLNQCSRRKGNVLGILNGIGKGYTHTSHVEWVVLLHHVMSVIQINTKTTLALNL